VIRARVRPESSGFAARLTAKARMLAEARGENAVRARRNDPHRWRLPRLLWPIFTKG